ncbi:E3 ubiquitin-protein ligase bre1 [Pseudozyma hubeiensis SY62]|uniref:E3 ubiquitin protein ligase n=1 Tax=Pseudozyma hubeiensis (strain SY62) TaxID=1305764 RepID=R9NWP5_PSEHS|nr:E3 ubiquitin-protein ligase bre1 [Pseudozyma hubeiensis SY62]GAC92964.1 E3 ubiquitin-protein ligase bre1 [Pseudozyma hubeiensis SY62]
MLQSMSGADDRKRALVGAAEDGPRKRLHSDEATPRSAATPNNDDDDEEALHPAYAGLEAFRKEAIYRKLLEARRDMQRIERRSATYQDDLAVSEQRAAVLQRFWNLLLTDLATRLALQDQDAFASSSSSDSRSDPSAMEQQLQQQSSAVLQSLSKQGDVNVVELQQKLHDLADEASRHKQDLFLTQSKLQRAQDALAQTTQKLSKVEHEYVRYQSNLLRATEGKPTVPAGTTVTASEPPPAAEQPAALDVKKDAAPSSAAEAGPETSEALQKALEELESARQDVELTRRESDSRYAEIQTLNEEVRTFRYKLHETQSKLTTLPEEVLLNSALYRELQTSLRHAQQDLQNSREAMQILEREASAMREERGSFQQTVEAEASSRTEDLEKLVKAKEADVTRLRSQRDELNAELTERRSREQVKFTQIEEMKALLNSKEERLTLLSSQVRRLRMTVAAFHGQSTGVSASAADAEEDQFAILSREAQQAQARVAELEQRLGITSETTAPNGKDATIKTEDGVETKIKAEADAEALGESELHAENQRLRLSLQAAEASSKAVDDELEKISAAYADLERQASVKVTDVSRMEEKALRWVTEKSKADNKYFSAMRAKDAVDADLRMAKQVHERQQKTIEAFTETERNFTAQLGVHEKQVTAFKKTTDVHVRRIETLERELELAQSRLAESMRTKEAASDSAKELINTANVEKDQRKRAEERIVRLEKDLESSKRQLAKAAASAAKNKGRRDTDAGEGGSERDFLNALLQCSSCKERYRNRILTKCYHTFCSECIDSRVQTRQRKCPHCALAFAVSDVQPLYLQ